MFVALLRRSGMFIALFRSPTLRSFGVRCVLIRESYKHPAPSERDVFSYPRAINILLLRRAMCSHTRSYKHPAPSERDVFSYPRAINILLLRSDKLDCYGDKLDC